MVSVFESVGEKRTAKNCRTVSLFSAVSKVFEKFANDRIFDHLEKCGRFSDFQHGFESSSSTADLLTVARAFNRSGATGVVALTIPKASDRVWHAALLHKLKSHVISGQIFGFISSFLRPRRLRVILDGSLHKNTKLMLEFLKDLFLVLHFSFYTLMIFLMLSIILLSMLMILVSALSVIRYLNCGDN